MNSMKSYFNNIVYTGFGIPGVLLEGKHEDWVQLAKKTEKLGKAFELQRRTFECSVCVELPWYLV